MWRFNILGDNGGSISYNLRIEPIAAGFILLNVKKIALKREIAETIVTHKTIVWNKFIDYFGLSIEANPSRVGKNNVYFPLMGYIQIP